jgi:hypothetical protein
VQSGQIAELIPRLDSIAERVAAHVLGRDGAAPRAPGGSSELDALRRRIDALERRAATPAPPAPNAETPP